VGEIFRTCPDRPWGPPSLLHNVNRVFTGGKEQPGRDADPSPPSSAVGHERVELYLYSSCGPYSRYRASVPVQGCALPLPLQQNAPSKSKSTELRIGLADFLILVLDVPGSSLIPKIGDFDSVPRFSSSTCRDIALNYVTDAPFKILSTNDPPFLCY